MVLAGFGRFGQTVLDELQRRALAGLELVVIVDTDASMAARVFEEQVGFADGYTREVLDADLRDPLTWRTLEERVALASREAVILIACGDHSTNVRSGLAVARRFPTAYVVARTFERSRFAERLAADGGFSLIAVSELAQASMSADFFPHD